MSRPADPLTPPEPTPADPAPEPPALAVYRHDHAPDSLCSDPVARRLARDAGYGWRCEAGPANGRPRLELRRGGVTVDETGRPSVEWLAMVLVRLEGR